MRTNIAKLFLAIASGRWVCNKAGTAQIPVSPQKYRGLYLGDGQF
jgi:hypothetical protein